MQVLLESIPLDWRLAIVFVLGTLIGTQINRGIYRLAWKHRSIGPWSPLPDGISSRPAAARIPVLGWLWLRAEARLHGSGYWLRPLCIELGCGLGFAALYHWELTGGLTPPGLAAMGTLTLHARFLCHVILISLMLVATFIDFDEKTIPDEITIPGTLSGLLLAALWPYALLPVPEYAGPGATSVTAPIHVASPLSWPGWVHGGWGLFWGCFCFLGWCFAIAPWLWTTRRGWRKAVQYFFGSLARHPATRTVLAIAVVGVAGISWGWFVGGEHWRGLFTSLVGLAFGGGLIWAVRVVGTSALGQEAMGFGDVTLMAMIGSFMGWQAALMTFFLAPCAALLISVTQYLLTRRKDIAFGPYLCLGALFLIVNWRVTWNVYAEPFFQTGWLIPSMVLVCLVLMGAMLGVWRNLRDRWFFADEEEELPGLPGEKPAIVEQPSWNGSPEEESPEEMPPEEAAAPPDGEEGRSSTSIP